MNFICIKDELPQQWKQSRIVPIYVCVCVCEEGDIQLYYLISYQMENYKQEC
jgi:hypothetical protein